MTDAYAVPELLRVHGRYVRRQPGTRRSPMRVTPSAFTSAGLPVPEDRAQRNIYQLTGRRGEPWSPAIDAHIARFGGELLGAGRWVCIDCDVHLAVDGSVWLDGMRWLADAAMAAGHILDLGEWLAVRSPGDPGRRHGPGWHLWCATDPGQVRLGALAACRAVEIKASATAPGSPGYESRYVPDVLPVIPPWLAELAGKPRELIAPRPGGNSPARALRRLEQAIVALLETHGEQGQRNSLLYRAACRAGEAGCDQAAAEQELMRRAAEVGLVADDGEARCVATIRQGFRDGALGGVAVSRGC